MTSEADCVAALLTARRRLGESPTKAQYEELGLTPASATIQRVMGGWNDAKEAAGLETNPSRGSRVESKPEDVTIPDGVEWADLSVDQRWHYRNVEHNAERTLRRRSELRSWANERKREAGCVECGTDDPACLDFHHLEPDDKEMAITEMITYGHGRDALEAEMAKCEVICANCHRERHERVRAPARDAGPDERRDRLRRWVRRRKADAGGCRRCDETDPACLDYHHDGRKGATVAALVADGESRERIRREIDRCTVLCANCHRREHVDPPRCTD